MKLIFNTVKFDGSELTLAKMNMVVSTASTFGSIMDRILVHLRSSGEYTENEITKNLFQWKMGDFYMIKNRDRVLASVMQATEETAIIVAVGSLSKRKHDESG